MNFQAMRCFRFSCSPANFRNKIKESSQKSPYSTDTARVSFLMVVICMMFMVPIAAHADDWTTGDTALQAAFLTALAVDRGQSSEGAQRRSHTLHVEEVGWARNFIGPHPTSGQVNRYFAACAVIHTAVAYALPKPYRTMWQSFWIGVEVDAINSNVNAGISIRF